ncbi:MAG: hypothetical protein R3C53_21100 [Pirellulaceae bacterium]
MFLSSVQDILKRLALVFAVAFFSSISLAQEVEKPSEDIQRRVRELIGLLDAQQFSVREQASLELLEIGGPALELLKKPPSRASFELRQRAKVVHQQIESRIFDELSRSFLLDASGKDSYGLPGWETFSNMVGGSRSSKLLFLQIARDERRLLELVEAVSKLDRPGKERQAAVEALTAAAAKRADGIDQQLLRHYPTIGESMGLLFAAAALDTNTPVEVSEVLTRMANSSFHGYMHKQGYQDCLRKLLSCWIPKANVALAPELMRIALNWDLSTVLPTARSHLSDNFDVYTRELAFQCVAQFGTASDVEVLVPYLDEITIVEEFLDNDPPPGIPGETRMPDQQRSITRVNDLAAASAMLLLGEDPRRIFPNYSSLLLRVTPRVLAVREQDSPKQIALIRAWATALVPGRNES